MFLESVNSQRNFSKKMKSVIPIFVVISFFYVNIYCTELPFGPRKSDSRKCSAMAGPFCVEVTYIYAWNASECPGTVVENTVNKAKKNRYEEGVGGCLKITKDIKGPVGAKMRITEQSKNGGKLLKVLMNGANTDNICGSTYFKTFLDKYNVTVYDGECNFKKALSCLDPPIIVDKVIHEYTQTSPYGNFHFGLSYEVNGQCIYGYNLGLNFKCESECKRPSKS